MYFVQCLACYEVHDSTRKRVFRFSWKKRRRSLIGFRPARSEKTGIGAVRFIAWLDITASKSCGWRDRYVRLNNAIG
jgi:hypothetical protein